MYKTELIKKVAKKTGFSRDVVSFVMNTSIKMIQDNLERGKEVRLTGFGTFYIRNRAKSQGTNFKTGAKVEIPKMRVAGFRAGALLKKAVRNR